MFRSPATTYLPYRRSGAARRKPPRHTKENCRGFSAPLGRVRRNPGTAGELARYPAFRSDFARFGRRRPHRLAVSRIGRVESERRLGDVEFAGCSPAAGRSHHVHFPTLERRSEFDIPGNRRTQGGDIARNSRRVGDRRNVSGKRHSTQRRAANVVYRPRGREQADAGFPCLFGKEGLLPSRLKSPRFFSLNLSCLAENQGIEHR